MYYNQLIYLYVVELILGTQHDFMGNNKNGGCVGIINKNKTFY